MRYTIAIGKIYNYRRKTEMAKRKEAAVPAIVDSVEALEAKMQAMREAQRKFAAFTQEPGWRKLGHSLRRRVPGGG